MLEMWSADFDEVAVETPRKRRKIEPKPKTNLAPPLNVGQPKNVEDLVTHSKKITEVQSWLEWAGKSPEILLLTGPSGTAKSTTLRILAKTLGLEVHEWVNPVDKLEFNLSNWLELDPFETSTYSEPRQTDKFEAFAFRSSRYQSLFTTKSRRILLIEDFPNHFIWKPQLFHEFLARYKESGHCPIVFICTDDEKLNLSHDLFPNHVRSAFQVANIKFNPVSHTGLMKILKRNAVGVSKEFLETIAKSSNGDVRTALSSLQFSLVRKGSGKPSVGAVAKDTTTEFYQTLGRVLYPKRLEKPSETGKIFVHDVEAISEHYNNTFIAMLQENFLDTFSSLNDVTAACNVLSDCDLLNGYGNDLKDYAAFMSVVGLMTANKATKKGTFKPMNRSRWTGLLRKNTEEGCRPYPHLNYTRRTLNLDILPFIKHMPSHAIKLSSTDVERLQFGVVSKKKPLDNVFKVPLPPPSVVKVDIDDDGDDMTIEEFDD